MSRYKNRSVCVVDNGLFVELALTLTTDFGTVYYYCPWQSGYPKSNVYRIGMGLPGVKRVPNIWAILDDVDLFVFPDVYQGELQLHLSERLKKRVWGGRMGEELELDRAASKKHLASIGVDIGPWKAIVGLDALREWLRAHDNQYVKVSCLRGDMETFCSRNYENIEPRLDELETTLGAKKKVIEFIVEEEIPDAVEIGWDGYVIDGAYPTRSTVGIEVKDKGFVMKTLPYTDIPKEVRAVNDKMSETFRKYKYRGFFSSELRVTKERKAFMIDPCARMGSPPGELMQVMTKNWADILWEGANGVLVEPEFAAAWGAELLLISTWADKHWQAVEFPPSIRENVKLRNLTIIEGKYYVAPQWVDVSDIGAVCAVGDTQETAIAECKRLSEKVKGYFIEVPFEALDEAQEGFETLKSFGVKI